MRSWKSTAGLVLTASACALLSGVTLAGPAPRTHDGFFLRLAPGIGGAWTKLSAGPDELTMEGPTGNFDIAIGAMVSRSLALHATLFGWAINDPDAELTEGGITLSGELDGTLSMGAIGLGITNYFMPSNLYLSASVGMGSLELDIDGLGEADSDTGFVSELIFGKEWWVSNNWGLGLAGVFGFHSIPENDVDENYNGPSFSLLFSTTFN